MASLLKKKARSKRYSVEIIMDAYYADDLALLKNIPTKAELYGFK